ncbi:CTP synthase ura7 [Coniosporium tulheliwenetii]|uniref:CTP synthase ura7 n=1 Tax=Coniosporium tulheliwenetii TaxID=3383036 RepID=A0ACC2YEN7_9PEZI|nr:CTP synthase ura7 [Cladosporium sp. JES 115]
MTQLRRRAGKNNFLQIHVSYVPVINGEQKMKLTQQAIKVVRSAGLLPELPSPLLGPGSVLVNGVLAMKEAEKSGIEEPMPPGLRTKRGMSTPPEELSTDDEATFRADEEHAIKRIELDDSSYHASSD